MAKTTRTPDTIARDAVAQWATGILTNLAALSGDTTGPNFDQVIDAVREAILQRDPEHRDAITHEASIEQQLRAMLPPEGRQLLHDLENEQTRDYMAAQEAGYLIGVQVGLRLAGGAR